MPSSPHIIIIAGEASGDMHAASLVEALRSLNPQLKFSGLGGEAMKKAGVEIYEDLTQISVVGFCEVVKHFWEFRRIFYFILRKVQEIKPAGVILVDYPGFNLMLAKCLKRLSTKVIYYISPQVWAWKENRVEHIKRYTDKMLVLFKFEKDFYGKHGLNVEFVGHPLIDHLQVRIPRHEFLSSQNLSEQKLTLGILPGSRQKEIENILPAMLDAAKILNKEFPHIQFLLIKAATISRSILEHHLKDSSLPLRIVEGNTPEGINACDVCMVASGTATLETAILNKPMVVVYKTSLLTYWLARHLIKIPYIAMANVVAGRKIVPECIQFQANGPRIAEQLKNIFTNELTIAEMKFELKKIKESLGESGASHRAAKEVLSVIGHSLSSTG